MELEQVVKFCLLTLVASTAAFMANDKATIQRHYSKKDLLIQREAAGVPIREVFEELKSRTKRAAGVPDFSRSVLNDDHPVAQIKYSGQINSEVIFVLTYDTTFGVVTNSNIYRSSNYGKTFNLITSQVGNGATVLNNILVSPENHMRVFFVDATRAILYVSEDEGASFTTQNLSPSTINPTSLLFHPTEQDWILAHDPVNNALYVSRDFGRTTFTKIADNVMSSDNFEWGTYPYDSDRSTVYYVVNEVLYTQRYPYDDSTRNKFDRSLGTHSDYLVVDRFIFASKIVDSDVTLWVSADRQPFRQAKIPSNYNHQNYIVDSIRSLQAFVIVQHTNNQYNLYLSDEQGVFYYQSLSDISVELNPTLITLGQTLIDLEIVESMNYTTYIANQNVRFFSTTYKRTLISFDAGANWNRITPPVNDTTCVLPQCSLHLYMLTSDYWRTAVYSQASAPGIIIAHGSTGQYLNEQISDDDVSLFISHDGGSTWSLTLGGTWGVRVLDHGGLIVAARDHNNDQQESRTLMHTCNQGISWSPLTFNSNGITVYGLLTEPGETTTIVSLFGIESVNWVIVVVNFTNIFSSVCGPNDYYNWAPFDQYADTGCLLGASVTIELRKPEVCCLNGNTYNRVIGYSLCNCTIEDYECDYGYKHANGFNGACVRDSEVSLDVACGNGEVSYAMSQGYRKIGGDVCAGGIESSFVPLNISCCYAAAPMCFSNSTTVLLGPTITSPASSINPQDSRFLTGLIIVTVLLVLSILAIISLGIFCIIKLLKSNGGSSQFQHQLFTSHFSSHGNEVYIEPISEKINH